MQTNISEITCPYCLYKFSQQELVFRASHSIILSPDAQYTAFSMKYLDCRAGAMPWVIYQRDFKSEVKTKGVVTEVYDRYDYSTKNRICPLCHNSLPRMISRIKTFIIPVFGNKGSGKSSYISVLIHNLVSGLIEIDGYSFLHPDVKSVIKYQNQYEKPLYIDNEPPSPQKPDLISPVMLELRKNKKVTSLFMFYDMDNDNMQSPARLELYERVMQSASAVVYIMDMEKSFRHPVGTSEYYKAVQSELQWAAYFGETFAGLNEDNLITVPSSIVLLKSDTLSEPLHIEQINNKLLKRLIGSRLASLSLKRSLARVDKGYIKTLSAYFKDSAYFAASCYTKEGGAIEKTIKSENIEAPFVHLLNKLGIIKNPFRL